MQHQTTSRGGEHCRAITADRLILDGMLFRPEVVVPNLPVDVFLLIHGTGSNFSATGVLEAFTAEILARGTPVLRVNTRGHDRVASIPVDGGGMRNGGAAYEVIDECRHDIAAWLELLAARGLSRVALVGHSMGAVKAIYSQALEPHPNVKLLIAISPPRFCHANFMTHPKAQPFRDDFARASQLVGEGRGEEMISVKQPLPLELTAAGFIAKYGPHDDYDIVKHLLRLTVPTLVMVGDESVAYSPAFDSLPETLSKIAATQTSLTFELVCSADTSYQACLDVPFTIAAAWLNRGSQTSK
ncbi:MAG: alpha/beta fold hydrolase [Planctomycetaceae bacterium]